jgi:hypothetical protein
MLLKEHKDLKVAIIAIPPKEKDKLLLRLIAKDKVLTEHLHFKLLEDEDNLKERHELLMNDIEETLDVLKRERKQTSKDALTVIRKLNGKINHHYKVTKDVNTELDLRIFLLNQVPVDFKESIFSPLHKYNEKLMTYFLRTTLSAFNKYKKLHEDLQFDFKENFNAIFTKIYKSKQAIMAEDLGLPKEL